MNFFKYIVYIAFLILLFACSTSKEMYALPQTSDPVEPKRPMFYQINEPDSFDLAVEKETRTYEGKPGPNYWTNYANYKIDAQLSPADTMLYGKATIAYHNNSPDTLRMIVMELVQNIHKESVPRKWFAEITGGINLDSVFVNNKRLEEVNQSQPGFHEQGTNLYLYPNQPIAPSDTTEIKMSWNFKIPKAGASSGRMGYSEDNLFYLAYWFPHISVYDDVNGWFSDNFTGLSEFYYGFGDYEMNITLPEEWIVMSTGKFLNPGEVLEPHIYERYKAAAKSDSITTIISAEDFGNATIPHSEGILTWKFNAKNVRDVAFSATKESQWDATRASVGDLDNDGITDYTRINTFWRESAPLWTDAAEYTQQAITSFSEYNDVSYPWPHMTSVEGTGIIGGGMEFPMMTIIGGRQDEPTETLYGVIAHEVAHIWLPMIISSNERRNAWMDEGSASYLDVLALENKFPDFNNRVDLFKNNPRIIGSEQEGEIMRWSDNHGSIPGAITATYMKPASVLTSLKEVLGKDLFEKAWKEFMNRWAFKHPTPYDFFNTFEDVSGQDLDWFWKSWYFETWVLDQAVSKVTSEQDGVTITVKDYGKIPMPVLLKITLEDESEINRRIEVDNWLDGSTEISITLSTDSPVSKVEIDPEHHFLDINRENNVWSNELE